MITVLSADVHTVSVCRCKILFDLLDVFIMFLGCHSFYYQQELENFFRKLPYYIADSRTKGIIYYHDG